MVYLGEGLFLFDQELTNNLVVGGVQKLQPRKILPSLRSYWSDAFEDESEAINFLI